MTEHKSESIRIHPLVAVHGISKGGDADAIKTLHPLRRAIKEYANRIHQEPAPFSVAAWASEATQVAIEQGKVDALSGVIGSSLKALIPGAVQALVDSVLGMAYDYARDVIIYQGEGKARIKARVRSQIEQAKRTHACPPVVFAHSMGSVVVVDLLIDWIHEGAFAGPPGTWPIHALMTAGSPLGIDVPLYPQIGFTDRAQALRFAVDHADNQHLHKFHWVNLYDPDDPICTGSFRGRVSPRLETHHYPLLTDDYEISTGGALLSHVSYFDNAVVVSLLHPLRWMEYPA